MNPPNNEGTPTPLKDALSAIGEHAVFTPVIRMLERDLTATKQRLEVAEKDTARLKEVARRQYWAMREGDNIVRHIRTTIFPGWTNLSDHDVTKCLEAYEKEHGIAPNYAMLEAQQHIDKARAALHPSADKAEGNEDTK